jgi:hypothetical protein
MGDTLERRRQRFDQHAVVVLSSTLIGPHDILDERGRLPLQGVTTRDVKASRAPVIRRTPAGRRHWRRWLRAPRRCLAAAARPDRRRGNGRVLERVDERDYYGTYLCETAASWTASTASRGLSARPRRPRAGAEAAVDSYPVKPWQVPAQPGRLLTRLTWKP